MSFLDSRVVDTVAGEAGGLVVVMVAVVVAVAGAAATSIGESGGTEIASDEDWFPKQKAATG